MAMHVDGGCFCGAITWEATIDEDFVAICHCRDCQVLSGSAFRTVGIASMDAFRFTSGEPKHFSKTGDSGNERDMAFCGDCGTHLCSLPGENQAGDPQFVSIRLSTSRQFAELRPSAELFCDSKLAWMRPIEGAQTFPGMPG